MQLFGELLDGKRALGLLDELMQGSSRREGWVATGEVGGGGASGAWRRTAPRREAEGVQ